MKRPIGFRLSVGFLATIILTGLIILVAFPLVSELGSITRELTELELAEVHLLWRIRILLTEMESDVRHLLNNGQDRYGLPIREKASHVRESLATYEDLHPLTPPKEKQLLREFATRLQSLGDATAAVMGFVQEGKEIEARELVAGRWERLHQGTLETLDRLLDYEDEETRQRAALVQAKSLSGRRRMLTLAAGVVLLSLVLALGITFSLTRPISKLVEATERVARGDLESRAEVGAGDEIGLLASRFNEMLDRLNRSFEDQQRFYADASHELRSPLTVIRGEAEVALRGSGKPTKDYREALKTIVAVADQMGRFVDELLFLARSESGQVQYDMAALDLAPLLEDVARQGERLSVLKGVHLELDLKEPSVVWGDAQRLRQLFFVLVDNAIKYTERGGKVTISLKGEPSRAKALVADTGIGIPGKDLPHIFDRFYRVERADCKPEGSEAGTGLGLSIAQSIAKAHAGEIGVESELGLGTTFSVLLPRA